MGILFNIAGWGVGVGEGNRIPRFLQTVQDTAISLDECSEIISRVIGTQYRVESLYLCTKSNPFSFTTCVSTPIDFF